MNVNIRFILSFTLIKAKSALEKMDHKEKSALELLAGRMAMSWPSPDEAAKMRGSKFSEAHLLNSRSFKALAEETIAHLRHEARCHNRHAVSTCYIEKGFLFNFGRHCQLNEAADLAQSFVRNSFGFRSG